MKKSYDSNLGVPAVTHADEVIDWLRELGYSHCFFVAGGNSMHLLNRARQTMTCVPFVHEVAAGIAAEYFNATGLANGKAFVLVTAGPGLTNLVTALAGAYLESRELLVLGGQVKSTDLSRGAVRQRGIQEVDGVAIAKPISKLAIRVEKPLSKREFISLARESSVGRPGPVFLEYCLDVQGSPASSVNETHMAVEVGDRNNLPCASDEDVARVGALLERATRPVLLIGGGLSRSGFDRVLPFVEAWGLPVMTTWNGSDRIGSDHPLYFGRPNTWGQRSSNILIQRADLVIAVGTRLGLQQTGFNWQEFVPDGEVVQVDIDPVELTKGHPRLAAGILGDAEDFLTRLLGQSAEPERTKRNEWVAECRRVRNGLTLSEIANERYEGYLNTYDFVLGLSHLCVAEDIVIPCSSGGAFNSMMQAFGQKTGQVLLTDKGLASMGYGLAGALGAALSSRQKRTVLVEGDGGFSQNLQELATISAQGLNIKIFIFANEGYASIRMTQRNYFSGAYLGCDTKTGLGFPNWKILADAYGIGSMELSPNFESDHEFLKTWHESSPFLYIVPVHPEQTYFPKISSRVTSTGSMESAPLHEMTPPLPPNLLTGQIV